MAALSPITVNCPACEETLTVALTATPGKRTAAGYVVNITADPQAVFDHAAIAHGLAEHQRRNGPFQA